MWKKYGLGFAMFGLFAGSWIGQWFTHSGTIQDFWNATFENWQSEAWQVGLFIVMTKYLVYKGSPQSRDGDDELQRKVDQILAKLPRDN
jgi:hypothetical protein